MMMAVMMMSTPVAMMMMSIKPDSRTAEWITHLEEQNYRCSSLLWSEGMLKVCVEFAVCSLFALLTSPFSPFLRSCL